MASIISSGLGSGLDIQGLVNQLMAVERQPLAQLDAKEAGYQAKLAAYGQIKSALSAFQTAVSGLQTASVFQSVTASSSDTSVFSATAGSGSAAGSYAIEVTQLAQSQKLASGAFDSINDALGTGSLIFQFGTDDGEGGFTPNSTKAAQTVVIDSTNNTLSGARDAINAANIGVSATIINDGTGYKLLLTSKDTGADNSLKITVSNDSVGNNLDDAGLSRLAYDPAGSAGNGKNLSEKLQALNALLNVDGFTDISKSSNTITDVIDGITLQLNSESDTGVPTILTVSSDTTSTETAVKKFVDAYNEINKTLKDLTAYNPDTKQGSVLLGDNGVLSLQRQLRSVLTSSISGAGSNYKLLSSIGVSFQTDGSLSLDSGKLKTAIGKDFDNVKALFATVGRATDALVSYSSATDNTKPGSYAVTITQLATQGYYGGETTSSLAHTGGVFTSPLVIDSSNNSLVLKVDGVQTGTITLSQGSYGTAAALVAEIQSRINGDSALKAADSKVTVSFDEDTSKLTIKSDRYGSASKVEIISVGTTTAATLGLDIGVSTEQGLDVAGTINGVAATGSGQFLTGALGNDAYGLKIQITGGALGSRGTVNYSQGYAYQVDSFIKRALAATGSLAVRTEGLNKSVEDIGKQRDAFNRRLVDVQKRYLAQFNAMDALVGQLRSTSDFLTQQLANLASITPTGN